ncbi:MAG: hypothetical protein LQ343_004583 [Gyalolechia ehrenbergii]|nr:MAG: hypothetical protein LQ343_004583 [Gyalolechia ehrenbergii]
MFPQAYKSHLSLRYTFPPLPLRTLDLHIPTNPPSTPSYSLIYIHGGAFRDPAITSQSLLPSLPHLFPSPTSSPTQSHTSHNIAAIASLNYRLSAYPSHPTDPSDPGDESRNAQWPEHIRDVRRAVEWLFDDSAENSERGKYPPLPAKECILIGHSVGATISFAVALALDLDAAGTNERRDRFDFVIKAIVGVEGIYDFTALRDAHVGFREIYEEFTTAALGDEGDGGWERGNVGRVVKEGKG